MTDKLVVNCQDCRHWERERMQINPHDVRGPEWAKCMVADPDYREVRYVQGFMEVVVDSGVVYGEDYSEGYLLTAPWHGCLAGERLINYTEQDIFIQEYLGFSRMHKTLAVATPRATNWDMKPLIPPVGFMWGTKVGDGESDDGPTVIMGLRHLCGQFVEIFPQGEGR